MKIVAIVQARMGSTRLPNKVLKTIKGLSVIEILLKRLAKSKKINEIIVAIPDDKNNKPLAIHIESLGFKCFQGSEDNVLERFVMAGRTLETEIAIRITGDCPLIDASLIDDTVNFFINSNKDYVSNCIPSTFPDGLDVEVFKFKYLEQALKNTQKIFDKEHVTPYLRDSGKFSIGTLKNDVDLSHLRWTLDEPDDYIYCK